MNVSKITAWDDCAIGDKALVSTFIFSVTTSRMKMVIAPLESLQKRKKNGYR